MRLLKNSTNFILPSPKFLKFPAKIFQKPAKKKAKTFRPEKNFPANILHLAFDLDHQFLKISHENFHVYTMSLKAKTYV